MLKVNMLKVNNKNTRIITNIGSITVYTAIITSAAHLNWHTLWYMMDFYMTFFTLCS